MGKVIRVLHIFTPGFGYTFSGQTFVMQELFRRWHDPQISLDWYGTTYDFLNEDVSSPKQSLFSKNKRSSRLELVFYNIKLWVTLLQIRNDYDLIQVHNNGWGGLVAPMIAHLVYKKAIYLMSLLGSDNPGALISERWGRLKLCLFKKYDGIVGLSPALVEDCQKLKIESKLLTLPNFVSFDPLLLVDDSRKGVLRERLKILESDKVLLYVGSVMERKGVDILISTFIQLAEKRKDIWLIIVGPHTHGEAPHIDDGYVNRQITILEQAGLPDRVVWAGMVNDQLTIAKYYRASDIFIFPSRAEGQGNVILEAMAAQLPIVATSLVGVTDMMVDQGQQGFLIAKDDIDGFAQATTRLLENNGLRLRMGKSGRARVLKEFGFDTYANKLAEYYLSMI
jgi:glycosyltransferase involved in cell wall biosynthesis